MYFDGDIGMAADALIEMFGKEAPLRALERAADKELDGNEDGRRFWQAIADEVGAVYRCLAAKGSPPKNVRTMSVKPTDATRDSLNWQHRLIPAEGSSVEC